MPWALLLPLVTSLFGTNGTLTQIFTSKAQAAKAQSDNDLQVKLEQIKLSSAQAQANVQAQVNQLNATSQNFKLFSYILLTIPIIVVLIAPNRGKDLFNNLGLIPVWYAQLYVAVTAVIWGLPVAANAVSSIFTAVQSAWQERQQTKADTATAIVQANQEHKEQIKKELFDTMRQAFGTINQAQVNALSPVLDKFVQVQQALNVPNSAPVTVNNEVSK